MRKAYEKDWRYSILKAWCDVTVRSLFIKIESEGIENLPKDGAILLAPNHCNTLMDALVVLQDRKDPTLFGARADIFRKPILNRFLRFLRILPLPRGRDGLQEVLNNRQTMDEVIETLEHGMPYASFCEGTHRPKHSLLPLKKGIVRTALQAHARFGDRKPVYLVPMGLEYEDYYRLQTPLQIRYGEPINVSAFVTDHPGMGEAEVYRTLLAQLRERISSLITYLPDDESYDGRWALTKIESQEAALAADAALIEEAATFDRERKARRLSMWSFGQDHPAFWTAFKAILCLVLLPAFLFCAVVSAPMWLLSGHIVRGLKDKAFARTARFGVKLAMTPIMVIIWLVAICLLLPAGISPIAGVALTFLTFMSHRLFYSGVNEARILISDIRLLFGHKDLKDTYASLCKKAGALITKTQDPEV